MTGPNNTLPNSDGNYREVWHYRREVLPKGVSYLEGRLRLHHAEGLREERASARRPDALDAGDCAKGDADGSHPDPRLQVARELAARGAISAGPRGFSRRAGDRCLLRDRAGGRRIRADAANEVRAPTWVGPLSVDDALSRGLYPEVERFLASVPRDAVVRSPSLSAAWGRVLLARGDYQGAIPELERARDLESRPARRAEIEWSLSQGAILWNDFAAARDYAESAVHDGYGLVPDSCAFSGRSPTSRCTRALRTASLTRPSSTCAASISSAYR